MEFLIQFLARLFNQFKLKNPAVAAIVLLVLGAATYTATQGSVLGLFPLEGILKQVVSYVLLFLTAVTGSQTYQYTAPTAAPNTEKKR